jgi:hypothetical protein
MAAPAGARRSSPQRGAQAPGKGAAIAAAHRTREVEWVARARGGDARAFRLLYDAAFRIAWAAARRTTGHRRLAEALAATTLRRAFAELAAFDGSRSLGAWLLAFSDEALRECGIVNEDVTVLHPAVGVGSPDRPA